MELPKYIQDKIKQQNEAVFKAQKLEREIDNWCDKSGIDIWSNEYQETKAPIEDAVSAISRDQIDKLYNRCIFSFLKKEVHFDYQRFNWKRL